MVKDRYYDSSPANIYQNFLHSFCVVSQTLRIHLPGKVNRLIQDHAEEVGGDGSNYYMAQVREFSRSEGWILKPDLLIVGQKLLVMKDVT